MFILNRIFLSWSPKLLYNLPLPPDPHLVPLYWDWGIQFLPPLPTACIWNQDTHEAFFADKVQLEDVLRDLAAS